MESEKPSKKKYHPISLDPLIGEALVKKAKKFKVSQKKFTEEAIMYFVTRDENPCRIKQDNTNAIQTHVTKEINRFIGLFLQQEKTLLNYIFNEIVTTHVFSEMILRNLHKISELSNEETKALFDYNKDFFTTKHQKIIAQYFEKKSKPEEKS